MVFYYSLRDRKSPQMFRTRLSILADLNNAVVCIDSTRPLISDSSTPGVAVSSALIIMILFTH